MIAWVRDFFSVPPLSITSKKSKSKILTERTKSIHVINVFHWGEPQSLATSIIYFAIMICLCVNPRISLAEPGMPTRSLWGTDLYLQSRTRSSHTQAQAGPAQERECPGFAEAELSKAEWHHLGLKGEPKCQPAQGDKEHPGEGHKGGTDEQRLALLPQGSQLGLLLNFSQHSSIENYTKLLISIWQSWHQQVSK